MSKTNLSKTLWNQISLALYSHILIVEPFYVLDLNLSSRALKMIVKSIIILLDFKLTHSPDSHNHFVGISPLEVDGNLFLVT